MDVEKLFPIFAWMRKLRVCDPWGSKSLPSIKNVRSNPSQIEQPDYAYHTDHFGIKVFLFFSKNDSTRIFSFCNCNKITSDWKCQKLFYKILTFKFYFLRSFSNSRQFTSLSFWVNYTRSYSDKSLISCPAWHLYKNKKMNKLCSSY